MTPKIKRHPDPALAEARRAQVLNAAADCFRRRGYHAAAMAEIARIAGMSPGHIYNYFRSKEEIIEAIIARDMEQMFTQWRQLEATPGPLLEALLGGLPEGVDRNLDLERGAQLEMMAEAARNPKVAKLLRAADARARQRLREMLTGPRGTLRDCDADELDGRIEVLLALSGGMPIRALMNPALKRDVLIAALRPVCRMALTPGK